MNNFESFLNSKTPLKYILLFAIIYAIYTNGKEYYHFNLYTVYGIAECTEIEIQNTNTYAAYKFYVDGKRINGSIQLGSIVYPGWVGKHFKVQYSSKDPEINEILLDKPVYDTVRIKKAGFVIKVQEKKEKRNQFRD
ncbi:hypothetical protein [Cellulophaga sp. L1A9]|uniref:hypothetical protein n=1 Tax=Cellulophaga sp. L1A9 TaxID=2686362 RepID=UPI00131D9835|nr:hypothetical protein [Cellulophaga sp. L1A9]